jgi:lipopolysaccharide export system protein LptA
VSIDRISANGSGGRAIRKLAVALPLLAAAVAVAVVVPGRQVVAAPLAVVDGEAIDVSADRLEVDIELGTAILRGNVALSFGDIEIHCPTVDIRYDRSPRVSFARGSGGVTARLKGTEAAADTIEFDAASRRVALSGGVRLSRGRGWVRAERASLDIATGKVSLEDVKGSIPIEAKR